MSDTVTYAWQQKVLDAFRAPYDSMPSKINIAEKAIALRLHDSQPPDLNERVALKDAVRLLEVLFEETKHEQPA